MLQHNLSRNDGAVHRYGHVSPCSHAQIVAVAVCKRRAADQH